MRTLARCLLILALCAATPALAASEPPARVGRVSLVEGTLAFYGPGDSESAVAKINLPAATDGWIAAEPRTPGVGPAVPDEFTNRCRQHDYRDERVAKARYVSPGMTGFEELEEYGRWRTVRGYGPVWFPQSVAADWTPYRQGRWVWVEPW